MKRRAPDLWALSRAASTGDMKLIGDYLAAGGNANAGDDTGTVLLHDAAYFKQPDVVAALLKAGADVNARNREGQEPLLLAIEYPPSFKRLAMVVAGSFTVRDLPPAPEPSRDRQLTIVRMLLDAGAEVNPRRAEHAALRFPPLRCCEGRQCRGRQAAPRERREGRCGSHRDRTDRCRQRGAPRSRGIAARCGRERGNSSDGR